MKSKFENASHIEIFENFCEMCGSLTHKCYAKDHLNPDFTIELSEPCIEVIDPTVPPELLDKGFDWVVGTSSHLLHAFGDRAVSSLNMPYEMPVKDRNFCKAQFDDSDADNEIRYIDSFTDLREFLEIM